MGVHLMCEGGSVGLGVHVMWREGVWGGCTCDVVVPCPNPCSNLMYYTTGVF